MKFFNKFLTWVVSWIVVAALLVLIVAVAVHFIRAYERVTAKRPEVAVTIPEGSDVYDIDRILSDSGVLARGEFLAAVQASGTAGVGAVTSLEGRLFPDTYDFYIGSDATSVIQKMTANFNAKVPTSTERDLIIASLVQKEVASSTDMAIVAGILEKRLAAGMFLDVDATICYAKQAAEYTSESAATSTGNTSSTTNCYPITATDLKIDSPYNTYRHTGLPPTPIGNPGVAAIEATLHPATSSYWYYLSDPKTGETIYAETLAEQNTNIAKYLAP